MSQATTEHLVRMANQIAANLAAQGEAVAVRETATHIARFWDPRMKAALLGGDHPDLAPIARAAVDQLRAGRSQ
ncbi:MAG TPA: formate dehydrogenase subunit delta [Novosphingobium sp.]